MEFIKCTKRSGDTTYINPSQILHVDESSCEEKNACVVYFSDQSFMVLAENAEDLIMGIESMA